MKRALVLLTLACALAGTSAYAEVNTCPPGQSLGPNGQCQPAKSNNVPKDNGTTGPMTALPDGELPVGEATNIVFLAPVAGALGLALLAGGGATGTTTSTPSTTN